MFISREAFHQTLAILPIFANEILIGMGYGWLAPAIRRLRTQPDAPLSLNDEQCSWVGCLHDFGRILGTFVAGFALDICGRKTALALSTVVYFAMWPSVAFANSAAILYATRFVFGCAVGINDVCLSIYVAENCGASRRSIFGSVTMACYYGGQLLEFAIATRLPYPAVAATNAIVALCALSSMVWCTESAQFLIAKGDYAKAEHNLRWLRGGSLRQTEFEQLKRDVVEENSKSLSCADFIGRRANWKTVLVALTLSTLTTATGQPSVVTYASLIFVASETLTPDDYTTIFGVWQFAAVCASLFVVNRCGRKALLVCSFVLMSAAQCSAAALYYAHDQHAYPVPHFPWLIFGAVGAYAMVFCLGVHPISFVIRGEIFPQKIKAVGGAISITGNSMAAFVTTKIFLLIADSCGMYANFLIYAALSAASAVYVMWAVPETKGKTLLEIQKIMETW